MTKHKLDWYNLKIIASGSLRLILYRCPDLDGKRKTEKLNNKSKKYFF